MNQTGTLYETGGGRFDWIPASGDPVEGVNNACGAPINVPIIPAWDGNSIVGYERAGVPARQTEWGRVHLALLQVVDSAENDSETLRAKLARYAREWEHHKRSQDPSGDYVCVPLVVVDNSQSRGLFFQPRLVDDQIPDYDQFTHWAIRGGYKAGVNGEAYLNSNKLAWYMGGMDTFVHESWHMCRGRGHSNGGGGSEYGDSTCIMGRALTGLNAFHLLGIGLLRSEDIAESATVYLVPVEVEEADLRNGEIHAAKVEHNGRRLLISRRKTRDQHFCGQGRESGDAVYVHAPEQNQWWRVRSLHLDSTQAEVEIDGIVIRNLGGGEVQIVIDGQPAPAASYPKALPPVPGDEITEALSGIWHDPRFEHQGFDLTVHGDRLTGYWFGHHPRGKHGSAAMGGAHSGRRWMVLHGHARNGHVEFTAQSVMNGEPRDEGRGTIRFDGNTALLRWETGMYGREHYRLARVTPPKINPRLLSFGDYSGVSAAEYDNPQPDGSIKRETSVYYFGPGQGGQDWYVMHGQPDALTVHSVEQRHRSTHEGKVSELGTARLRGGEFEMLGRTYTMESIL